MDKLSIYNVVKSVPENAQKAIKGGRLKGMTDINPMWRIKVLTEQFGPCGIGWYYEITKQWIETGANNEIVAFTNINLYVKNNNEWSKGIPGTGGSSFVAKEKSGLYTSDECYKMSLTDALSVACKALGIGADVYWQKGNSKYSKNSDSNYNNTKNNRSIVNNNLSDKQIKRLYAIIGNSGRDVSKVKEKLKKKLSIQHLNEMTRKQYDETCNYYENNRR